MIRSWALCLSLVMAAALAIAAAPAGATPLFKATAYPAKLKTAGEPQVFRTPSSAFKCSTMGLSGTLKASSSTLTLSPGSPSCTFWDAPMTVKTNGCTFQVHLEKPDEVLARFDGSLDLLCPEGKSLEFISFFTQGCSWTYVEKTGLSRVTLENKPINTPDVVYLYFEVTGLKLTEKGKNSTCGEGTLTNGILEGVIGLQAETEKGVPQDFWVE